MHTTTRSKAGRGLDANAPQKGAAADCYAVATTATMLYGRAMNYQRTGAAQQSSPMFATARHAVTLHRISGQLHRLAEADCNGYHEETARERAERREARLRGEAQEVAGHYGLRCYFQTDPRGCALYLIAPEIVPGEDAAGRYALTRYVYPNDKTHPASFADLQRRWIEANYTRGHAVVRMGR